MTSPVNASAPRLLLLCCFALESQPAPKRKSSTAAAGDSELHADAAAASA